MKKFLKENWFKIILIIVFIFIGLSVFYHLVILSHQKESLKKEQNEEKQQRDVLINECIKDAYTELKTLQENFDWIKINSCAKNLDTCDLDFWNKAKDDAFKTYNEEWVPQCKLGNRVFIHYELHK